MEAPHGYTVVAADASQIEARLTAWLAGCKPLVQQFADGEDVYSTFATSVYNYEVNKNDHPAERFVGKTGILGLGFGTGRDRIWNELMLNGQNVSMDFAQKLVTTYRTNYKEVPALWDRCEAMIFQMLVGTECQLGPITVSKDKLIGPLGFELNYPGLRIQPVEERDPTKKHFGTPYEYYRHRYKGYTTIYGAKLTENIIQHLAFCVIYEVMTRMHYARGLVPQLQVHDELVYIVPTHEAEDVLNLLVDRLSMPPSWARDLVSEYGDLPLAAEGSTGKSYGDCK
jgi:DNA polymerase